MKGYQTIKLTHGVLNKEFEVVASTIVGWFYSDKTQTMNVYCMGQTIFPTSNTAEEINQKLAKLAEGVKYE